MPNKDFKLTEQQMSFFQTFGYISFPGLMADRVEEIDREFDAVWAEHGGGHNGKPHDEKARSCIVPFIDQSEVLSSLLDDPRILGIATSFLGDDFDYMGSDGNYYVGDTGWHSDGGHAPGSPVHIKLALYLDPLTRDTGALRVIPGSHLCGDGYANTLSEQIGESQERWGVDGRDVPSFALETQLGDLALFNHNTKHAAFGGSVRRRMFTINLCERYPEDRLDDLRKYISNSARFWIDRKYGEKMVRTAGPERMRHLEQIMANDGHLAELSRQARERMSEPSRGQVEQKIEEARHSGATELNLTDMGLIELPESLGQLTQLQELDLGNNQLTVLPESLGNLTQLTSLSLYDNPLTALPEWIVNLTKLTSLFISDIGLRYLPVWIGHLESLEDLEIGGNSLTEIPTSVSNLSKLSRIGLGFATLTNLHVLVAGQCDVTALPDWLGELSQLGSIYIDHNVINDLRPSLVQLEHLTSLSLDDNPLKPELNAAYKEGLDAVKAYLRARATD